MLKELLAQDVIVVDYHQVSHTQKKGGPIEQVETVRHDFANEDGQYLQTYITTTVVDGDRKMAFGVMLSPSTKLWQPQHALEHVVNYELLPAHEHPLYDLMYKIYQKIGSLI
jgi:hypothetical protein